MGRKILHIQYKIALCEFINLFKNLPSGNFVTKFYVNITFFNIILHIKYRRNKMAKKYIVF